MSKNKEAIKIIEKYDLELNNIKNSEGWYKYKVAVKELLKKDFVSEKEKELLKKYSED